MLDNENNYLTILRFPRYLKFCRQTLKDKQNSFYYANNTLIFVKILSLGHFKKTLRRLIMNQAFQREMVLRDTLRDTHREMSGFEKKGYRMGDFQSMSSYLPPRVGNSFMTGGLI